MRLFWEYENIYTYWQYERALTRFVSSEHNDESSRLRNGTPKDPTTSTGDTGAACERHIFP